MIVTGVKLEPAMFEVEIRAFEDRGARWELPVEEVGRFQVARDSPRAPADVVAALTRATERFDRPGDVACDPAARRDTLRRLAAERELVRARFREVVKGHAIVLAELGLCPYHGNVVRDPGLFAAATETPLPPRRPASFVSATFAEEVARAHFEGGRYAALWRQPVPEDRLLMTFLETEALNHPTKRQKPS